VTGRLIWFFGPSAAGKDTLIRATAGRQDHPLRTHLNLGDEVEVCNQSLNNDDRASLAAVIAERHRREPPLLIKGQTTDVSILHLPQDLKSEGAYQQEVVFVWAHPSRLARRCALRAERAKEAGDLQMVQYWQLQTEAQCTREMGQHQVPSVPMETNQRSGWNRQGGRHRR
jgi:hypothetical protein